MYDLKHGQNFSNCYYDKNACIVRTIPSSFGIVKRRKELHPILFRFLAYKIDLPISENKPLTHGMCVIL